jgi:hypothetical protein
MATACRDDICSIRDLASECGATVREVQDAVICSRELIAALVPIGIGKRRMLPRSALPLLKQQVQYWRSQERSRSEPATFYRPGFTASTAGDSHALSQMPDGSRNPVAHLRLQDARPRPLLGGLPPRTSEQASEAAQASKAEAERLRGIYEYVSEQSRVDGVPVPQLLRRMIEAAGAESAWRKSLQTLLTWCPEK